MLLWEPGTYLVQHHVRDGRESLGFLDTGGHELEAKEELPAVLTLPAGLQQVCTTQQKQRSATARPSTETHRRLRLPLKPSTSWAAPEQASFSPGFAPLSLLSVSEVCPAPFLRGSASTSPFWSAASTSASASTTQGKADRRHTGLLLRPRSLASSCTTTRIKVCS